MDDRVFGSWFECVLVNGRYARLAWQHYFSSLQLVVFIIFWSILSSVFGSVLNISVMSALADADEPERRPDETGRILLSQDIFSKTSNAVGHVVAGIAIEYCCPLVRFKGRSGTYCSIRRRRGPFAMV